MQPKPKKKGYSDKEITAGMAKSLESIRKERMMKGGPSNLSKWPSSSKGLYKTKKK
jgi:hypothetical protein